MLPFDLIEVLDAPTPFIIGVHSDQKLQALANFDGLWVDLDGASVHLTENVKLAPMPERPYNRVLASLFQVNFDKKKNVFTKLSFSMIRFLNRIFMQRI